MDIFALNSFIVEAKANTYVGGGSPAPACRTGSRDIGLARRLALSRQLLRRR